MVEVLSLEEAHQLIHELRTQKAVLETQNRELKDELAELIAQSHEHPSADAPPQDDIDDHKMFRSELLPDNGLLRCIIDTIGDLIYVKDIDGVYRGCNKASEKFVGLTESEQIGKTDFDFFSQEMAEEVRELDRQVTTSGQEHCVEEWVSYPDGKRVLLESKKAPFYRSDGNVVGIVGISRDITVRKMAEKALKQVNQELDAFVYTVSHDLRTPLIPIIGYAEILQQGYREHLDERAQLFLDEILSSAYKMQEMMADLLTLATVGQIESHAMTIDVGEVVQMLVSDLATHLSLAGVTVKVGELPSLNISKTHLVQVLDNLIVNAMKYGCESGDVIEVGYEFRKTRKVIYVRDHGQGVPTNERDRIFKTFFRGRNGTDKQGTGIGLATVKKIAKTYGGDAWVEETPGGGATFCVEIEG